MTTGDRVSDLACSRWAPGFSNKYTKVNQRRIKQKAELISLMIWTHEEIYK